jgi:ABC-type sugar transport system permease subunit
MASSAARMPHSTARVVGMLLLVPVLFTWVWSYLLPTITTVLRGFQRDNLVSPPQSVGTRNYDYVLHHAFGAIGFGLLLVVTPLIVGLLVAPLLAVFAHRGGTAARRVTLGLTAVPLVCYAPVALAVGWMSHRLHPGDLAGADRARGTLVSIVGWTSIGVVVAVGTTLALAALRGRRPGVAVPALGAVVALGVLAAGLQQFTIPLMLTDGGPLDSTVTPVLQILQISFGQFILDFGPGSASATLLLLILAVLGIAAVGVLLAVRARVEYAPAARPASTGNAVALVVTAVLLLGLLVVVGYALMPWLGSMFGSAPLLRNTSTGRILANTWLPPLVSALVGVFVALLGGIGIGACRPLGRYSELLLLIFAPWLFVGTGPLALAAYERARSWDQVDTFLGLIPPTWLSIPALVLFTLLFRGLSGQWRAAGGGYQWLGRVVALPALPMLGGAVLLTWLAGAQQLLWPEMIASNPQNGPASVAMVLQMQAYSMVPSRYLGVMGLVFPLPLLVLFVLAFVALAVFYLERLAIQVGPEPEPVPFPGGVPAQLGYGAWQAVAPAVGSGAMPPGAPWLGKG